MQFPGYWVDGEGSNVTVERSVFDDTELSPESDWKEAYQNADPSMPRGFIKPEAVLRDVCRRILNGKAGTQAAEPESQLISIFCLEDLARLVLRLAEPEGERGNA